MSLMRYESEMTRPLISFLLNELYLDAVEEEFSAGYGIADIVGIKCRRAARWVSDTTVSSSRPTCYGE